MNSEELLKALAGPEIPERPSVTVHLERGEKEDQIWLSQCVDPNFDMQLLAEGLTTAICIAAQYRNLKPEQVLEEVVFNLERGIEWHGTIKRKE